ncbi:hypothetical protein PFISCL1PPCAC_27047, partial [Pristionchus fissidentatus]
IPLLLSFLPIFSADILKDHLTKNVDLSVSPCDDFFRHTCSQAVNWTEFPTSKIINFYTNISERFKEISESINNPIMNDIFILSKALNKSNKQFDRTQFINLIRMKCTSNAKCYNEEFAYYFQFYNWIIEKKSERLVHFASSNMTMDISMVVKVLPAMVEATFNYTMSDTTDEREILFYKSIVNRLFVMDQLKKDGVFDQVVQFQHDLQDFKQIILERFRNTSWLSEKDEFGLSLLSRFEDTIKNIVVTYDLGESDSDLKLLRSYNSGFNKYYYNARQRSTGNEALDIALSLNFAFNKIFNEMVTSGQTTLFYRVEWHLMYNAFYIPGDNEVGILAPFLFPALTDNSTLNKPYSLFSIIGHELFHSVVSKEWANKTSFKNEMECMHNHYNKTCNVFGEGVCNSGNLTFEEDGPDLEGFRTTYQLLMRNYETEALKEIVFNLSNFTVNREQSMFYLYGMSYCSEIIASEEHTDVHSHGHIRVNGVLSQMPEFSKAFSCKSGQKMYAEKGDICDLFGGDSK